MVDRGKGARGSDAPGCPGKPAIGTVSKYENDMRKIEARKINEIQEIYRRIYLKGMNNSKALDAIQMEMSSSKERDEIINFIRSSDRGVMKGYNNKP